MNNNLITKQINLMQDVCGLIEAAKLVEHEELIITAKNPTNKQILPIASTALQADFLSEALCDELRSSILEVVDRKITLLESLGISFSDESLADIQSTSSNSPTSRAKE